MWNFREDLKKWKEAEIKVMNILKEEWWNIIQNPEEKEMDLLIIEKWIEVKLDEYAKYSWNFYIEFECNGNPSWLFKEEKVHLQYWAHSDWDKVYMILWDKLKQFVLDWLDACYSNKSLTSKWMRLIENWWNGWRTKGLLIPTAKIAELADLTYNLK